MTRDFSPQPYPESYIDFALDKPDANFPEHVQIASLREVWNETKPVLNEISKELPGSKQWIAAKLFWLAVIARYDRSYGIAGCQEVIPGDNQIKTDHHGNFIRLNPKRDIFIPIPKGVKSPSVLIFAVNRLSFGDARAHAESAAIGKWAIIQTATKENQNEIQWFVENEMSAGNMQVVEASPETLAVAQKAPGQKIIMNTTLSCCHKCAIEVINEGVDAIHIVSTDFHAGAIHPSVEAFIRYKLKDTDLPFEKWFEEFQTIYTPRHLDLLKPLSIPQAVLNYLGEVLQGKTADQIEAKPWVNTPELWEFLFDVKKTELAFFQTQDQNRGLWIPSQLQHGLERVFYDHFLYLDKALQEEKLMNLSR